MEQKIKINDLKVTELKYELEQRGIDKSGKKTQLVKKLKSVLNSSYLPGSNAIEEDKVQNRNTSRKTKQLKYIATYQGKIKELETRIQKLEWCLFNLQKKRKIQKNIDNNTDKENSSTLKNIVDKQKIQIDKNKIEVHTKPKGNLNINTNVNKKKDDSKPRLLILADSHGRDMARLCKDISSNKFETQCLFKPNAFFQQVTENISELIKDFNKKDYVILIAGINNALKGNKICNETVIKTFKQAQNTNLMCVTTPYWHGRNTLNQFVYEINCTIYNASQQFTKGIEIIDSNSILRKNDYSKHGLHLNTIGKYKLCKHILHRIQDNMQRQPSMNTVNKNSIFSTKGNLIIISPDISDSYETTSSSNTEANIYPLLPHSDNDLYLENYTRIENNNLMFSAPSLYPVLPTSDNNLASLNSIKKGKYTSNYSSSENPSF